MMKVDKEAELKEQFEKMKRSADVLHLLNDIYWNVSGERKPQIGDFITMTHRTALPAAEFSVREGFSYKVISIPGDVRKMTIPERVREHILAKGTNPDVVPDECIEILDDNGQPFILPFPSSLIGFAEVTNIVEH